MTLMTEIESYCPECCSKHVESRTEHTGRIYVNCEKCMCKYVVEYTLRPEVEVYMLLTKESYRRIFESGKKRTLFQKKD